MDSVEEALLAKLEVVRIPSFSGDEEFGKYLDLHECYNLFINSQFGYPLDYVTYLTIFPAINFEESNKYKTTRQYKEYVKAVLDYLICFLDRAHPLMFLGRLFNNVESEFEDGSRARATTKDVGVMEAKVKKLCQVLKETIEQTKQRVQNKQAMTINELVEDRQDCGDESGDEAEVNANYNKLPKGWDGKPIPYWLYKLHGLHQEFRCEICGDYTYKGRREFERHFNESRHQYGMHCLGIPNSKSFHEITSIDDAKILWQNIQRRETLSMWNPQVDEEYEDFQGNVYNKRTYIDLVKQGLI